MSRIHGAPGDDGTMKFCGPGPVSWTRAPALRVDFRLRGWILSGGRDTGDGAPRTAARPSHPAPSRLRPQHRTAPLALPPAKPARRRGCQCKSYLSKDRKLPWEHKARFNFLKTLKRLMIRKGNAPLAEKEGMETEVTVTSHLWLTRGASLPITSDQGDPAPWGQPC